jgi:bifunctional UDP-N-acetylglucosamine pyrophosphorylase/glucosamine-1-phosphate N-acetyltransferase
MATIHIAIEPTLAVASFAGRSIADHLRAMAQAAELTATFVTRADRVPEGAIVLDGRYLALDLQGRTLAGGLVTEHATVCAAAAQPTTVADVLDAPPASDATVVRGAEGRAAIDRWELTQCEQAVRERHVARLARAGAHFEFPLGTTDLGVVVEPGAHIGPNVVLRGSTVVAATAVIHANSWLEDTTVAAGAVVKAGSVCEAATIGIEAAVGPMAHLRTGTVLERGVKVGNFVETKKAVLREGAKASHLTYLGDTEIGAHANIGAGTITCNYDGYNKHRTEIGAGAFIGSNSALVAPLRIGAEAIVAAGSTITRDVPEGALAVVRPPQRVLEGRGRTLMQRNARKKQDKGNSE